MKTAQRKNRWTRAGAGALLCLLLTLPLTVGTGVAPASARPVASGATGDPVDQCTPARGALVAVDFGPFGGPVRRGCDLTPETGYQLLKDTGFRTEGTEHDGPAFICRIGHPTVHSGTPYPTPRDEECRLTPPTTAYWSYWVAAPGQTRWTYSTLGAMGRRLSPGDVDAWVFGGTQAGGTDGGPAFTPDDVRQGFVDERAAGNWLADHLKGRDHVVRDGEPDPLQTAETAFALAATGGHTGTLDRLTAYLRRTVTAFAYPNGTREAPEPKAAARLALLARINHDAPRDFGGRDLIGGLARAVCPARDKSTGCEAEGAYTHTHSVFGQALGIMAQLRVGEHRSAAAPVDYLLDLQQPSGAWTGVIPTGGPDEVDSTAIAAMALDRVDDPRARAAVDRALAWIASRQLADGGFTGAAGTSVNSTALAVQGFSLDAKTYADRLGRARAFLAGQQNADGGFNTAKEDRGSDLRASTQAVGGTTGISFALLDRRLPARPPVTTPPGTNPPPPDIVTPDYPGGDGPGTGGRDGHGNGNGAGGDGGPGGTDGGHAPQGGHLARTGTSADTLLPVAALLATAGAALVTAVGVLRLRGRRTTGTRADGGSRA